MVVTFHLPVNFPYNVCIYMSVCLCVCSPPLFFPHDIILNHELIEVIHFFSEKMSRKLEDVDESGVDRRLEREEKSGSVNGVVVVYIYI